MESTLDEAPWRAERTSVSADVSADVGGPKCAVVV